MIHSKAAYAPKGSYPAGPMYWAYGTTFNVLLNLNPSAYITGCHALHRHNLVTQVPVEITSDR